MMIAFSQVEIMDPEKLFGRKELIDKLVILANRHDNVAIIGTRRFGKTCLLKCVETKLREGNELKSYPIYFDLKKVGSIIKGTDNVYKYMISMTVARLCSDKIFTVQEIIKRITIIPSIDWEDIFEQIESLSSVKVQKIFEELIFFFSELLGKTILFLIDEYEYLFKYSFDSPEGFMQMRTLSTQSLNNNLRPFSFWIAGAVNWDCLCSVTGSGELNVINQTVTLTAIDKTAFYNMWQQEIASITDSELRQLLQSNIDFAYIKSGGVPFYGKHIGSFIVREKQIPDYSILKSFFHEIESSLHLEEKKLLYDIAKSPQNIKVSKSLFDLIEKGLIKQNGKCFEITVDFYRDFLKISMNDQCQLNLKLSESQIFVKKITHLIEVINKTLNNKNKAFIFDLVNDSASLENDLRAPCLDKEKFADFSSSLYRIYFERTKSNNKKGNNLPSKFRNNEFAQIVDILRHTFGGGHLLDKFQYQKGKLSKPDVLEILTGNKNEPYTAEDFLKLQKEILKRFETELIDILRDVQK